MRRVVLVLSSMAAALLLVGGLAVGQEEANPAVLVGAGDIASCTRNDHEATADLLDGISGTVATFGDNAYESGTSAEFDKCYDSSWGRHKARTKPSVGDEDYKTTGASGYFEYFGAAAGDPQEGYYSYELGSWHVVVLNSNCEEVGGCDAGSEQERWLREDLEAHSNACTAAYFHHPLFSSSGSGNNSTVRPFWEALYEADAEVVLSGHAHHYERFAPQTPSGQADPAQDIREFVVGTGGYSLNTFKSVEANSEKRISDSYGVIKLALRPEGYDWRFVTDPGGTVADSGSGSCHG
jgi:acid phosphatase type 7